MDRITSFLYTENETFCNILAFPLGILELFVLHLVIKLFYQLDVSKKSIAIFLFGIVLITIPIRIFIPMPYNWILNMLIVIFALIILYKLKFLQALLCFSGFLIATAFSECIVTTILAKVLNLDLYEGANIPIYRIVFSLFIYATVLFAIYLVKYFKTLITVSDEMSKKDQIRFVLNILMILLIVCPNLIHLLKMDMQISLHYIIYNLICSVLLFLLNTRNAHKFNKLDTTTRELETAKMYNTTLNQLVDENRGFKHDINNIVQSIGGYIELNDLEGLKKYYDTGLLASIDKVNNLSMFNPDLINSPPVFSLLIAKRIFAIDNNITFRFTSFFDYSSINMNIYDFTKILGILLDNAMEASLQCEAKIVELHVSVNFQNRTQCFKIRNTYQNKDINIEKMFEKDFSTKKVKSGFGLWEIKQIVNKTENIKLTTYKDETYLTQKLEIYF